MEHQCSASALTTREIPLNRTIRIEATAVIEVFQNLDFS